MAEENKENVSQGNENQGGQQENKQVIGPDGKAMTPEQVAAKEAADAKAKADSEALKAKYEENKNKIKEMNLTKEQMFEIYGISEPKAPDKYSEFKLPEGFTLDAASAEIAHGVFKELNLSQDAAQKLIETEAKFLQKQAEAKKNDFEALKKSWKEESISKLGADAEKKLQIAGRAMEVLGGPELRQILADSGLEYHPAMVDLFIKAGTQLSPDTFPDGKKIGEGSEVKTGAGAIYPEQGKK